MVWISASVRRSSVLFCVVLVFLSLSVRADIRGGIIRRQGTHFVDSNGIPFLVHGCNFYWLMDQGSVSTSRKFVNNVLADAQKLGLNVGRTWAFSDGGYRALQKSPGIYDENVFKALDYALDQARKHNIRLVLTLVNNHEDFGGKAQYARWGQEAGYQISNDDDFFTHDVLKTWYTNHIMKVLTRVNTISGVRYMDDPTIFSWELINEPRCESDPSGNTMAKWVTEMAAYVKSIDRNHLLTVGLEGFYGPKHGVSKKWAYPFNSDNTGTDYIRLNQIANIDYATVHSYPDLWLPKWTNSAQLTFLRIWVNIHIRDAKKVLNMPVLFSEFGKNDRVLGYKPEQRQWYFWTVYNSVYSAVEKAGGGASAMLWQLLPKGMEDWNDGFAVYASDPVTSTIIDTQTVRLRKVFEVMIQARNATLANAIESRTENLLSDS